ncbi:MAG: carboxyl transferase domain-containing protein [Acidimicrobiia bacterium]|nr:carboxyl transferase domain-containing protein [Acidimicrobiia bacterium]
MQVIRSHIDIRSDDFAGNRAAMSEGVETISELHRSLPTIGGEKRVARHRERGKMLVRERIEALVDPDTPFLELSPLAGWNSDDSLGARAVTGIGIVSGVETVINGSDLTVKGGTATGTGVHKALRAQEISRDNRLPYLQLVESGGAALDQQAEVFIPGGATFKNLTQLSAAGIPVVSLVFGSSTAGGAYQPGMSDYVVMVRDRAEVYLGGPPLVKMAIDEDAEPEDLGGAAMHSRVSGLSDYLATDEVDAVRLGREIMAHLNWRKLGPGPSRPADPPAYDPGELLGVVPSDLRTPFDIREVLARVVDGSRFEEFKPLYGEQLVAGWASVCGFPVGVLANNGILFSEESQKGAQFIQLCNQVDTPIVFVQNITGFMVGTKYEQGGIIKHGAQLINAVSNSTVPHFTVMVGASYGAGNYGMAGKAFDPRFVFSWPSHRIGVMGGKQLAGVLDMVARSSAAARGEEVDEEVLAQRKAFLEAKMEHETQALYATGRLWDDGIIDPRDTRTVLGIALSCAHNNVVGGVKGGWGVFRM